MKLINKGSQICQKNGILKLKSRNFWKRFFFFLYLQTMGTEITKEQNSLKMYVEWFKKEKDDDNNNNYITKDMFQYAICRQFT